MNKRMVISICALFLLLVPSMFAQIGGKPQTLAVTIVILEGGNSGVQVPLSIVAVKTEKSVSWNTHRPSEGNAPSLEFTASEPKSLTITLQFDSYEETVAMDARFTEIGGVDPKLKRPPVVAIDFAKLAPRFRGVIRSHRCTFGPSNVNGPGPRGECLLELLQTDSAQVQTGNATSN